MDFYICLGAILTANMDELVEMFFDPKEGVDLKINVFIITALGQVRLGYLLVICISQSLPVNVSLEMMHSDFHSISINNFMNKNARYLF